ncbi:MAG TPA: S8 family serine peptidase [Candidatus Thermoplasmatota archaeon]|nr:S8 family serine peptidase [Candidatus Thermoplasmatota archaeon]
MLSRSLTFAAAALFVLPALLAGVPTSVEAGANEAPRFSPDLERTLRDHGEATALITLRSWEAAPREALAAALRAAGSPEVVNLHPYRALLATVDAHLVDLLRRDGRVEGLGYPGFAEAFGACEAPPLATGTPAQPPWVQERTRILDAHALNLRGNGQVVAILDTGVSMAPKALSEQFLRNQNPQIPMNEAWRDFIGNAASPTDACGHGTAVAGVAVDRSVGSAPRGSWIAARIGTTKATQPGEAEINVAKALEAYQWILALPEASRPDVVVNSWGRLLEGDYDTDTKAAFQYYLRAFLDKGIVSLYAAGNTGSRLVVPADYLEAVAVRSIDSSATPRGPSGPSWHGPGGVEIDQATSPHAKPDLTAPGHGVVAPWRDGTYRIVEGSSFATPFAAGVGLLVRQLHKDLSGPELKEALLGGSNFRYWPSYINQARPNNDVGWGILNAMNALHLPSRPNFVLLVGDFESHHKNQFSAGPYYVKSLMATQAGLVEARNLLRGGTFGTLVLGNLDPSLGYGELFQIALEQGTGILLIGDPGEGEFDGVQAYVREFGGTVLPATAATTLSGVVQDNSFLFGDKPVGTTVALRQYAGSAPRQIEVLRFPAGTPLQQAVVPTGSAAESGLFSYAAPAAPEESRRVLLANAGASSKNPASERTPETLIAIRSALDAVRGGRVAAAQTTIDVPTPVSADVVIVGDLAGTATELAAQAGYSVASVQSWDYRRLLQTFLAEKELRTSGRSSVGLVVYVDIAPEPSPDLGEPTLATVEQARREAGIPALVVGGVGSRALERLAPLLSYQLTEETPTEVTTWDPHEANDYTPRNRDFPLSAPGRAFDPRGPTVWTLPYRTPDTLHAVVAVGVPSGSPKVIVAAVDPGPKDAPPGAFRTERALLTRIIQEASLRYVTPGLAPISGANALLASGLGRLEGSVYVITGLTFDRASLSLANVGPTDTLKEIRIQYSKFTTGGGPGVLLQNVSVPVEVTHNRFAQRDPAIGVENTPDLTVHFNRFISNKWALKRLDEGVAVVDASRNYFNQFDWGAYSEGIDLSLRPVGSPATGWVTRNCQPQVPPNLAACQFGKLNGFDPSFKVVPFYLNENFSTPFPPSPKGYLPDSGFVEQAVSRADAPRDITLTYMEGRGFDLEAEDPATGLHIESGTGESPPGFVRRTLRLDDREYNVRIFSESGRGEYTLHESRAVPAPMTLVTTEGFGSAALSGWTLTGASQNTGVGASGAGGYLNLGEAGAAASRDFVADPAGLVVSYYARPEEGAQGTLSLDWVLRPEETPRLLELPWSTAGFDPAYFMAAPAVRELSPGSWHRVEVRLHPPWADVYVDNAFVGTTALPLSPAAPDWKIPLRVGFASTGGAVALDEVALFRGESLAAALAVLDFETGPGPLQIVSGNVGDDVGILNPGGSTTGLWDVTFQPMTTSAHVNEGPQGAAGPGTGATLPIRQDEGFALSGGSPTYANTQSFYLESSAGSGGTGSTTGTRAQYSLPGGLRRYAFEQYVSLAPGKSFSNFGLLVLEDAARQPLLAVRLADDDYFLDVQGAVTHMDVVRVAPTQWHRLAVSVFENRFTLLLDDKPVLSGELGARAPVAWWSAGGGRGSAIFDNLRFGYQAFLEADPSAAPAFEARWTNHTSSSASVLRPAARVPEAPLPGEAVENPPLASHTIHVLAPAREESMTFLSRPLPFETGRDYTIRMSFYLPKRNVLTPPNDAFHLFRLDSENDIHYALYFMEDDDSPEVHYSDGWVLYPVNQTPWRWNIERGRWHTLEAKVGADGSVDTTIDGKWIRGLPKDWTDGRVPVRLIIGDTTPTSSLLYKAETGSGEVYIDDLTIEFRNTAPTPVIGSPGSGKVVGGHTRFEGTATDPDVRDAVSDVRLTLRKGAATIFSNVPARGTTAWRQFADTTAWSYGAYTLEAVASDGRATSAPARVDFTIDNRPEGGIALPSANANLGGIVTVSGTASPRFPLAEGELVDSLRYRIDSGPWIPLPVTGTSWSFGWDTRPETKGTHTITVEATKWLDTMQWTRQVTVDNSPEVTITAPAANTKAGGTMTFTGTARDRYVVGEGDLIDRLEFQIDGGAWTLGQLSTGADGVVSWTFPVDTHTLAKGTHTFAVRGVEDGDERLVTRSFQTDNTPTLAIVAPEGGASLGEQFVVRGWTVDAYPTSANPIPQKVTVKFGTGPETQAQLVPHPTLPGRAEWKLLMNVATYADGTYSLVVKATDGLDSRSLTATVALKKGATVALTSGTPRYEYLAGGGAGDRFTISVPSDGTELRLNLRLFETGAAARLYLRHTAAANATAYDFVSTGNETHQEIFLTPLTGLRSGTYSVWVQADGNATDFRLLGRVATVSCGCNTGGGLLGNVRDVDTANVGWSHAQA